jgi:prevent-host-death family protein
MDIPVRELKSRLSHYLAMVKQGAEITVTSHEKPVAQLRGIPEPPADLPRIAGVRWAARALKLPRSVDKLPAVRKGTVAELIVAERDSALSR